ncbi:MAG: hypothetical protein ACYC0X_21820 [Pirellulaceae bacterium]
MIQTTANPTTVRVTVKEIALYLDLQSKRRALLREADSLQRIEAAVATKLESAARANGAPLRKGKYTLSLVDTPGRPSWKNEFIRVAGEAAAKVIVAHLPTTTKLTINGV